MPHTSLIQSSSYASYKLDSEPYIYKLDSEPYIYKLDSELFICLIQA